MHVTKCWRWPIWVDMTINATSWGHHGRLLSAHEMRCIHHGWLRVAPHIGPWYCLLTCAKIMMIIQHIIGGVIYIAT